MIPIIPANTLSFSCGDFRCNDEGLFGFGHNNDSPAYLKSVSTTNKVSNTGVVSSDITGVGTTRHYLAATEFGEDKAIFAYGNNSHAPHYGTNVNMSNLVSNSGVVASDTSGVGTVRSGLAACEYGGDKGIFGYADSTGSGLYSITNKVSNEGVVASDTSGVGTARGHLAACSFN